MSQGIKIGLSSLKFIVSNGSIPAWMDGHDNYHLILTGTKFCIGLGEKLKVAKMTILQRKVSILDKVEVNS